MSSHHIVRENQEPALIVQYFNAIDAESLGQILEWSPTVITDNDNADFLYAEGIKVDVVFTNSKAINQQENTKVLPLDTDFLECSLNYLVHRKYSAVNILCNSVSSHLLAYSSRIDMVLYQDQKRFVVVCSGFEKWYPKGEFIYVEDCYLKSFQGMTYVGPGVFITEHDGFVQLEFSTSDYVRVGEDI